MKKKKKTKCNSKTFLFNEQVHMMKTGGVIHYPSIPMRAIAFIEPEMMRPQTLEETQMEAVHQAARKIYREELNQRLSRLGFLEADNLYCGIRKSLMRVSPSKEDE